MTLLVSTYGDAYHATQRRLRNMLDAHMVGTGQTYEEVDGGLTHLPGKYTSSEGERASRIMGNTVVDISIPPPFFKPVSLSFSWSPLF